MRRCYEARTCRLITGMVYLNRSIYSLALLPGLWAAELRDVEFARPAGVPLTFDANIPHSDSPQPVVILVHGGGWEAGDKQTYIRPWFGTLTAAKIAWISINYRLAPEWKHPAAVEDVEAAVGWVQANAKRLRLDPSRIALMGESAGGHLAALAALRGRVSVAGLVSFYGVHDLALWFEQRGEIPKNIAGYLTASGEQALAEASPVTYLNAKSPPMLFVHGTADKGVPHAQSQRMCDAARRLGVRCDLVLIEGAPHGVENWQTDPRFQVWKARATGWLTDVLNRR
jgi:acetyl esterase